MEDIVNVRPSVCFEVQKIIGVSIGKSNMKNYQVQWAPTWVSGFHLVGCEQLIEAFLKHQSVDETITTTGVTDSDDLVTDTRKDVSRADNVPQFTSGQHTQEGDIHDEASMVVNSFSENQERTSCLYSNTSNGNGNVKVESIMEANVSNEEIYTNDMDASNETNANFKWVKLEDMDDNADTQENNAYPLTSVYKNLCGAIDDTSGCSAANRPCGKSNPIQKFQNDVLEVDRKEIMLEEMTGTDQDRLDNDYGQTSKSTENGLIHTGDMMNTNLECNTFAQKYHLRTHLLLHTGQKHYRCSICNKSFAQKKMLEKHLKIHTADKLYICVECNKSFKQKSYLIDHFRLHTGDKPFKCTVCNKRFSYKQNLTKHFRLHTGEKPYKCSQCNRAFSHQSSFRRHLQSCKH